MGAGQWHPGLLSQVVPHFPSVVMRVTGFLSSAGLMLCCMARLSLQGRDCHSPERRAHCNCSSEVSASCTHPPQFSSRLSILQDSINKNGCFQTLRQGPLMMKMPCLCTLWERRLLQSPGKTLDTFQLSSYLWLNMPEYKSRETDNYSENQAGKVHFLSERDRKRAGNPKYHLAPEPQAAAQDRSLVCFVSGIGSFLSQGQPASLCY